MGYAQHTGSFRGPKLHTLGAEAPVGDEAFCRHAVERTVEAFGRLDILVNNAAEQHETKDPLAH